MHRVIKTTRSAYEAGMSNLNFLLQETTPTKLQFNNYRIQQFTIRNYANNHNPRIISLFLKDNVNNHNTRQTANQKIHHQIRKQSKS